MRTVLLLLASNCFMTVAWYGHLKHKSSPLWIAILASWLIALPEYMLQVPANRFGHGAFSAPQLKVIQEAISIAVFVAFCLVYLREPIKWNHAAAFLLIAAAVALAVLDRPV
ncbi:MAG: DMT family protein [Elusimicrobia bacterium]|nr:DMT family protein [Elusimicrobiota bacterium]